jgi:hypothetical protein
LLDTIAAWLIDQRISAGVEPKQPSLIHGERLDVPDIADNFPRRPIESDGPQERVEGRYSNPDQDEGSHGHNSHLDQRDPRVANWSFRQLEAREPGPTRVRGEAPLDSQIAGLRVHFVEPFQLIARNYRPLALPDTLSAGSDIMAEGSCTHTLTRVW